MRYTSIDAVLLGCREEKEKDLLLVLLTSDDRVIYVKDYSGQKRGTKIFPLYSSGKVFLYKKETSSAYTLRDSQTSVLRNRISANANSIFASVFSDLIIYFSKMSVDGLYEKSERIFTLLDEGCDCRKLFADFVQFLFKGYNSNAYMNICPLCEKKYADDEILGYDTLNHMVTCNDCANSRDVLFPGARRYLSYISDRDEREICELEISDKALSNVLKFEIFRLRNLDDRYFSFSLHYFVKTFIIEG